MPRNGPVDLLGHIILNAQIIPCSLFLKILLLPSAFPSVFAFSIHISNSSAAYLIPKPTALLQGIPCYDICRLEYTKQIFMVPLLFRKWKFMQRRGSSGATPFPQDNSRWRQDNAPAKTLPCIFRKKETYESFAGFYLVSFMAGRELALSLVFCHETVILSNWPPRNNCTGHRHHFLLGMA